MADKLGARKNSSWKAVCMAPDICKTPVGSSTPPLPYQVIADLGQSAQTVPNVRFNGDPCYVLDQSIVPICTGDEPGGAKGVKSGTVGDKVEPVSASTTVRATKKRVVRKDDPCTLNNGNCPGIYTTQPAPGSAIGAGGKPTANTNPPATLDTVIEVQAAKEKKGIWEMVSGPVHFVLGAAGFIPALGAIPDLLDSGIYALEGDMVNAGLSATAAIPLGGDAVKAGTILGKAGKRAAREAAERGLIKGLEKEGAQRLEREAAERALKEKLEREAKEKLAREAAEKKVKKETGEAAAAGGKKGEGIKIVEKKKSKGAVVKQNKRDGIRREKETERELKEKHPDASVQKEQYIRDKDGNIVQDPLTGEARRIDHVVVKDGKVIDSVETTGMDVDKRMQLAKEARIRAAGEGGFIKDRDTGKLLPLDQVKTRVVNRP